MQIVYISNRPSTLANTIKHIELLMGFIDEAIVCVPDRMRDSFTNLSSSLAVKIVAESEILDQKNVRKLKSLDHQSRNYLLRSKLIQQDYIADEFIMSDDDSRPMIDTPLSVFCSTGRHHSYFFYDLKSWNNNQTDFDSGQIASFAVLQAEGFSHLSYASHMPQIINKKLFNQACSFFKTYSDSLPLCEWSSYFNYALKVNPRKFHETQAYKTLCWPEHPLAWKQEITPDAYLFENFTPNLYSKSKPFEGLSRLSNNKASAKRTSIEKVILWRKFTINLSHPEQSKGLLKYFHPRTWTNKLRR